MTRNRLEAIQWGHPEFPFELASDSPQLLTRAADVFDPWHCRSTSAPVCHWNVQQVDGRWRVRERHLSENLVADTIDESLLEIEYESVGILLDTCRYLGFHAALLSRNDAGLLIVGPGSAGKSTLACGLWRSGWSLLSDDTTFVDPHTAVAFPAPRRVSLRYPSVQILGEKFMTTVRAALSAADDGEKWFFQPSDIDGHPPVTRSTLRTIIFLGRRNPGGSAAMLQPMLPSTALLSLLPYSNYIEQRDVGVAIRQIQPLADSIPCFDLRRANLERMIETVDQLFNS